MESYGLGLQNITNKDKREKGKVTQKNAFTIVKTDPEAKDYQSNGFNVGRAENLVISGFTIYFFGEEFYARLVRYTKRLAKQQAKEQEKAIAAILGIKD